MRKYGNYGIIGMNIKKEVVLWISADETVVLFNLTIQTVKKLVIH